MRQTLSHHNLRVYHVSRKLAALTHKHPPHDTELRNQARRVAFSVVLNIAEGGGLDGRAAKRHFQIAKASALETVAAFELAADLGETVQLDAVVELATAVAAMLTKLIR